MLDDFLVRALIAGVCIALICGPFGCFIIWRRMVHFGDTLAHSALLGVVLGVIFSISSPIAVFVVCISISIILYLFQRTGEVYSDAVLGIFSHSFLALGMVALAAMPQIPMDLIGVLFGDILAVSQADIMVIFGVTMVLLLGLLMIWRRLFAVTVSADLAFTELGKASRYVGLIFNLMLALIVAIAMKVVGILLLSALLVIPAATARYYIRGPEAMAVLASVIGVLSVCGGMFMSIYLDSPSGPSIVLACFLMFSLTVIFSFILRLMKRGQG